MRKSTLFISAVLTTFILAVLVGVVNASKNNEASAQTQPTAAVAEVQPTDTAAPTSAPTEAAVVLPPDQAANLVAQILGRTDLLSVETSTFNGQSVYLVKFMNGDQVYVSPAGMILSVVLAPTPAPVVTIPQSGGNNGGRPRSGGGGGGGGGGDDGGGGGHDD